MSGFQIDRERTFKAGADLTGSQFRLVKLSAANTVVVATAATDTIIGILQNAPIPGDAARVTLLSAQGTAQVVASAAIAVGARITATTGGKAVTAVQAAAGAQPTTSVAGVAIDAAAADGDLIEVMLADFKF